MVELTEVVDEVTFTPGADNDAIIIEDKVISTDGVTTEKEDVEDDEESDYEDDFDEEETVMERISALKDILSPSTRHGFSSVFHFTTSFITGLVSKTGSFTWMITTSALLLGVPLSLSILAEQQLIEMEKTFDLQKDANDILAKGENA